MLVATITVVIAFLVITCDWFVNLINVIFFMVPSINTKKLSADNQNLGSAFLTSLIKLQIFVIQFQQMS